jgi:glycosyltransferase involved in cell wall biosynthesis
MRFVAYIDQVYNRVDGALWTDKTYPLFVAEVGKRLDAMTILGRMREDRVGARFRMPEGPRFVGLPHYDSLAEPRQMLRSAVSALRTFWRSLDDADGAWIMGPHPLGLAFALITLARRRRLVLGVRQEFPAYARRRHPGRRSIHLAADLLEAAWRLLGRCGGVVVVGPELARQYGRSRRLYELHVSMMRAAQIVGPEVQRERDYGGELVALSVGRLDEEKNPLLLADALAGLRAGGRPWRLVVCGEGTCEEALAARLRELGVAEHAELRGYVPIDGGLRDAYLGAHAFLHVSWTEGVPQVLYEAFAARLPIVATDVGGVAAVASGASLLIGPGDPGAAVAALERIAAEPALREKLAEAGAERAAAHTLEAEAERTAAFLSAR